MARRAERPGSPRGRHRRWGAPQLALGAAVALVVLAAVVATRTIGADAGNGPTEVSWLALGDSYASGVGIDDATGTCVQSPTAWGPGARDDLEAAGTTVADWRFVACTGARAADVIHQIDGSEDASTVAPRGGRYDLVTLTVGGNDLGFGSVMDDCIALPDSRSDLSSLFGGDDCDVSEDELVERVRSLLGSDGLVLEGDGDGAVRGSIADLYRRVVDGRLTERGHLVVVGYPRLFAPSSEWSRWELRRCQLVTRGDADMLGRVAEVLDEVLAEAVDRADGNAGRVHYVSVLELFRGHELCGPAADWITGLDLGLSSLVGGGDSFHPNAAGHRAQAALVAEVVRNLLDAG